MGSCDRQNRARPIGRRCRLSQPWKLRTIRGTPRASVGLNPSFANDGAVFLMVLDNHLAKFVVVTKIDVKAERRHALLVLRKLGSVTNSLADARDNFRWHPGWRDDAKPVRGVKSRRAAFGPRWHLRQHRVSLMSRNCQHFYFSTLDEWHDGDRRGPNKRNLSTQQVIECRRRSAVGDMSNVDLCRG